FKGERLPFSEIEFVEEGKALQFEAADKTWRCDLESYQCKTTEASSDAKPTKGSAEGPGKTSAQSPVPPAVQENSPRAESEAARQAQEGTAQSQGQSRGQRRRGGEQARSRRSPDSKWSAFVKEYNVYVHSEDEGKDYQ